MECLNYDGLAYFKGKLDSEISATLIVDSTSGTIASFPDGADGLPIKSLTVGIEPVQNLNGYSEPWPAGGGANILPDVSNTASRNNCDLTFANNTATLTGLANSSGGRTVLRSGYFTLSAGTYYIKVFNETGSNVPSHLIQNGSDTISTTLDGQFTLSADSSMMNIGFNVTSGVNYNYKATFAVSKENISSYSPYSNECPISGWTGCNIYRTGKNLLNCQIEGKEQNGIISSNNSNSSIHLQGTTTGARFYTYLKNNFKLNQGTYRLSKNLSLTSGSISVQLQGFNSANQIISRHTVGNSYTDASVSITEPAAYYNVFIDITGMTTGTAVNLDLEIQLELGSTASAWEQFYGVTIPISWQSTAGTVYGGSITLNEDGSADVVATMVGLVLDGTQPIQLVNWKPTTNSVGWLYPYTLTNNVIGTGSVIQNIKCDRLTPVPFNSMNALDGQGIALANSVPYGIAVKVENTTLTTAAAINAYLAQNPIQVVYELATPASAIHISNVSQLTTLFGTNNIWADCGDITDLEYVADTKLYIQKLTQPTEDDMVANNNIASGKYFMVGNNLYLSTSAIAQGETIVPGTNCTATNLAAALNAINS